jgi:hypothetical protein
MNKINWDRAGLNQDLMTSKLRSGQNLPLQNLPLQKILMLPNILLLSLFFQESWGGVRSFNQCKLDRSVLQQDRLIGH